MIKLILVAALFLFGLLILNHFFHPMGWHFWIAPVLMAILGWRFIK